jgi:hypothetical protein
MLNINIIKVYIWKYLEKKKKQDGETKKPTAIIFLDMGNHCMPQFLFFQIIFYFMIYDFKFEKKI